MRRTVEVTVKDIIFNLYFWPVFVLSTILSFFVLPFLFLFAVVTGSNWPAVLRKGIRIYGLTLIRMASLFMPINLIDKSEGLTLPVIFTPNHFSSIDPYLFGLIPFENAFVTSWPFELPIYSHVMRWAEYIDSRLGWEFVRDRARQLLDKGCSIIIWPEGHRSRDGRLGRFKNGAFLLACTLKVPVVPVCIKGSWQVLRPGSRLLRVHPVEVVLMPPVYPMVGTIMEYQCAKALKQEVWNKIYTERWASGVKRD